MSVVRFEAKLAAIGAKSVLRLPESASAKLPSRGLTMVEGTINGHPFQAALEPDGKGSHWLSVDQGLREATGADEGDTLTMAIAPSRDWPEPAVPADVLDALSADPVLEDLWMDITPMARWDWIRWIGSTKNPETRRHRIEVACSKLKAGQRRPCCFNRSQCTDPSVSRNGVLIDPR